MKLGTVQVIVKTYVGDEAQTLLAQARGYREIMVLVLKGEADRDPAGFREQIKRISQRQAEEGA